MVDGVNIRCVAFEDDLRAGDLPFAHGVSAQGNEGDGAFVEDEDVPFLLHICLLTEKGANAGCINGPVFIPAHTIHSFILYHNRKPTKEPVENKGEI